MGKDKKRGDGKKPWQKREARSQPWKAASKPFNAPTAGLKDVVIRMGSVKDAVEFEESKKRLGRYIAVNFKEGGMMLQQAVEQMQAPTIEQPADPINPDNSIEVKKWEQEYDAYDKRKNAWEAVKPQGYQLFLQHCNDQECNSSSRRCEARHNGLYRTRHAAVYCMAEA